MVRTINFYFRISAKAGWAEDDNGNAIECYAKFGLDLKEEIPEEKMEQLRAGNMENAKQLVSETFHIQEGYLEPVSEIEYRKNTEEEEMMTWSKNK